MLAPRLLVAARRAAMLIGLLTGASSLVRAQAPEVPLRERARGAEQVVVGHVTAVTPGWRDNDFGDRLIVSLVHVVVDETLKGVPQPSVDVELEGGTIGTLTLRVSDLETFAPGDRGVFYLRRNRRGGLVPHLRGQGLQKFDRTGHVRGSDLTLERIRQEVRGGGAQHQP